MVLLLVAFPQTAISAVILEGENDESPKYSNQIWFDDIIPEVNKARMDYGIEKVVLLGPTVYTEHIGEIIKQYTNVDVELESMGE